MGVSLDLQRPLQQSSKTMAMGQSWWRSLRFVLRGRGGGFYERSKKGRGACCSGAMLCERDDRLGGLLCERKRRSGLVVFCARERPGGWFAERRRGRGLCCLRESSRGWGQWGTRFPLGKWFTKKSDVNHFSKLYKAFSDQLKWFSVWLTFYNETNTCKYWKYFPENIL